MWQMYENSSNDFTKKSVIFENTLKRVSDITEIPSSQILASGIKDADVVDARHLLVYALKVRGFYPRTIARMTGISHSTVNRIISAWDTRCKGCPILKQYLRNI